VGQTYPNNSPLAASSWLTSITQKQCQLFSAKPTETKESKSHNTGNGFTKHQTQWVVCRIIIDLLVLKHPKKSSNSIYLLQSVLPSKYAAIDHKHFWLSMNPSSLPQLVFNIIIGPQIQWVQHIKIWELFQNLINKHLATHPSAALSPCPKPLILGMPPPWGFTLHKMLCIGTAHW